MVTVGPARFLSLSGRGEAESILFQEHAQTLQRMAGSLRAFVRRTRGKDFKVAQLEALWWDDANPEAANGGPVVRNWKLLLRMPSFVRRGDLAGAAAALGNPGAVAHAAEVRLEDLKEGRCVQALHVGPRPEQAGTVERMRRAAAEHGLAFHGREHEVYLSDLRRVAVERRRTLLRRPVRTR